MRRRALLGAAVAVGNGLAALERAIYREMTGERAPRRRDAQALTPEIQGRLAEARIIARLDAEEVCETHARLQAVCRRYEKRIAPAIRSLAIWEAWASRPEQRGIGELTIAQLIEGCRDGDPSLYRSPAAFWKHWGVGRHEGENQHRTTDSDKAVAMAYNPERHAVVHQIGENLLRCNGPGPYKRDYDDYKARKVAEHPAVVHNPGRKPISGKLLAHKQALRYMGKRFLREFWRAWRRFQATPAADAR